MRQVDKDSQQFQKWTEVGTSHTTSEWCFREPVARRGTRMTNQRASSKYCLIRCYDQPGWSEWADMRPMVGTAASFSGAKTKVNKRLPSAQLFLGRAREAWQQIRTELAMRQDEEQTPSARGSKPGYVPGLKCVFRTRSASRGYSKS